MGDNVIGIRLACEADMMLEIKRGRWSQILAKTFFWSSGIEELMSKFAASVISDMFDIWSMDCCFIVATTVLAISNSATSVASTSSGIGSDDETTEKISSKLRLEKKLSTDMWPKSRSSGAA